MLKADDQAGLLSLISLRFKDKQLERQYKRDRVPRRFWDNLLAFILIAFLWAQSIAVDFYILPDGGQSVLLYKLSAIIVEFLLIPLIFSFPRKDWVEPLSLCNMTFNVSMVFFVYIQISKEVDPVYQSFFMVANLGGFVLGAIPFIGGAMGSAMVFVYYLIATLVIKSDPMPQIMAGLFFISCISFLGGFGAYQAEWNERQVWYKRQELEKAEEEITALLNNILPPEITRRKRAGEKLIVDDFPNVTVLFADIVSFTRFSELNESRHVVSLLNTLFTSFDEITARHNLEKIKTIGDCYMIAAGVPLKRADHAAALAYVALEMLECARKFRHPDGGTFELRIGLHTGPVAAGVIGQTKFLYDIWGDTVNTASRLESHGMPGRIHVSDDIYQLLRDSFEFDGPFTTHIKGKGTMTTWFLQGARQTVRDQIERHRPAA